MKVELKKSTATAAIEMFKVRMKFLPLIRTHTPQHGSDIGGIRQECETRMHLIRWSNLGFPTKATFCTNLKIRNVRFWPKADISNLKMRNVRFWPKADMG